MQSMDVLLLHISSNAFKRPNKLVLSAIYFEPNYIEAKCLNKWRGGVFCAMSLICSTHCFLMLLFFIFYLFDMTEAVSNRDISFIKAVLLW